MCLGLRRGGSVAVGPPARGRKVETQPVPRATTGASGATGPGSDVARRIPVSTMLLTMRARRTSSESHVTQTARWRS